MLSYFNDDTFSRTKICISNCLSRPYDIKCEEIEDNINDLMEKAESKLIHVGNEKVIEQLAGQLNLNFNKQQVSELDDILNTKISKSKLLNIIVHNPKISSYDMLILEIAKKSKKDFGKGSVMLLDGNSNIRTESISSGSFLIDKAIGIGGYPKGRIIEIYGPESSGKTTLALHAIAQAQKANGVAAFIDAEHSLDPRYAKNLESLVKSNVVDIVVVDSVAALVPKAELEGEMGDQSIGLQARLMSKALQVRRGEQIINNGEIIGKSKPRSKVVKNKVAPPFKIAQVSILYNKGIDKLEEIIDMGVLYNVLTKSGV
ncbi:hypothetical protein FQA39_LY12860 [Lamprigera yunnana]|nr:hypothetical protein FQA39_LY12860 [Lamprigera yunnana]